MRTAVAPLVGILLLLQGSDAWGLLLPVDVLAPGDDMATYDTDSGLAWLDLTATLGLSPGDIRSGSDGWLASGWRYATVPEACELFDRYLAAPTPCPTPFFGFAPLEEEVDQFMGLFGATEFYGGLAYSAGFLAGSDPSGSLMGTAITGDEAASIALFGSPTSSMP